MEMIQLIRLAFSVLNRLLMLRPTELPPSPVEHSLSAQPANRSNRHVVATIAQYIYHRHDPRLPVLATLLLKRLAMVRKLCRVDDSCSFSMCSKSDNTTSASLNLGVPDVHSVLSGTRS